MTRIVVIGAEPRIASVICPVSVDEPALIAFKPLMNRGNGDMGTLCRIRGGLI
ncbi:hypothetical protein [Ferviditalea candida]|uniref:Uncharacterized protein n=1 Tax=Ferviditalea candida TaxID=3108399 RepID=A0ABU5ZCR4_9BACL|nr:hypothetical protein [Paenibacillaceae bacterium T2]